MDATAPFVEALTAAALPGWLRWSVQVRPRRRSLGAEIAPGGAVVVCVPPGARPEQVTQFVRGNLMRIARAVRKAEDRAPAHPVKDLVSGEGFKLLGQHYRLALVDDSDTGRLCGCQCGRLITTQPGVPIFSGPGHPTWSGTRTWQLTLRRDAATTETVVGWYRQQGQAFVDEHVPALAARLGVDTDGFMVQVRAFQGTKAATWGTYRPRTHRVWIHWAALQFDRRTVEYLLTHELAHAARRGEPGDPHGPGWERLMDRALWDWRARKAQLDEEGRFVWMGEVKP